MGNPIIQKTSLQKPKRKTKKANRSKESYHAKSPEAKAKQLEVLRKGRERLKEKLLENDCPISSDPFATGYKNHIIEWVEKHFYIIETRKPVVLEEWQKKLIFEPVFYENIWNEDIDEPV